MQETETSSDSSSHRRNLRRIALICIGVACVLLLIFVPPLISVNGLQRRIARSISESLGRPVHLDSVSLNILPWPGFTLQNLVVNDDPAFSAEPLIRANTVTVSLRISSLWSHHVEFGTIRFGIDQNGSGPSVNLVRNDAGQWNIESILLQASRVNAAPTTQQKAGSEPRFPYIEAKGARINIKRGIEKLPLSLTDTEFSLWLSSPEQMHLRLEGHPARTDTNASDTGIVHVEGTMNRATSFGDVPIDLSAAWQKVPLGEATRIVTGNDAGWRGVLAVSAAIKGTLNTAVITSRAVVTDLHREDFSPAHALVLDIHCAAKTSVLTRSLSDIQCALPVAEPSSEHQILLTGNLPDSHDLNASSWKVAVAGIPAAWCIDWARLFSQKVPPTVAPEGLIDGNFSYNSPAEQPQVLPAKRRGAVSPPPPPPGWSGSLKAALSQDMRDKDGAETPLSLDATLQLGAPAQPATHSRHAIAPAPQASGLVLLPTILHLGKTAQATISANMTRSGYTFHIESIAAPAKLALIDQIVPSADAEIEELLESVTPENIARLDLACTREWGSAQSCQSNVPGEKLPAKAAHTKIKYVPR